MTKSVSMMVTAALLLFGSLPATSNYKLQSYGFGSGGTANSGTSNYSLEGITGEISGQAATTATYSAKPGFVQVEQAHVPAVTLTNPSNYYDKLKFVIDNQNNPTDALFALQVSTTSNFSSGVTYVQPDDTLGSSLALADFQTYSAWGGASGGTVIGLSPNTTYYIRAAATQGKYTESAYGPSASAATVGQQLSYCLYTNGNCAAGGNAVAFGALTAGTIASGPSGIGIDFATNADGGGSIYVSSQNGGLKSNSATYTIASATADLSASTEGYGAQVSSATQSTGGPFAAVSPYNGSANQVGGMATTIAQILASNTPLTGGTSSTKLMVLPANTTPEAGDYSDVLTFIAAASF